jgi:hypothetical protein
MPSVTHKQTDPKRREDRGTTSADQLAWVAALAILAIFIAQLWAYFAQGYYAGVDEATYFLTAKTLATHNAPAVHSPDPLMFMPANMNELRPGVFYQKYPIGFPPLVAIGYKIAGPLGAFLVNPILGCIALIGAMALAWELAGKWAAILLGSLLALHPLMVCYSTSALSHIGDLACVVWGLWCLWRWGKHGGIARAAGAGLLLGYAVSIRYTEAVIALPALWVILNTTIVAGRESSRQAVADAPTSDGTRSVPAAGHVFLELAAMTAGAVVALIPLMLFHWAAYGSPLRTGYGLTRESTAFSWDSFTSHAGLVLKDLFHPGFGFPALVTMAVIGLVVWLAKSIRTHSISKAAMFLLLWILPTLLLYTAYYWSSPYPTLYMRLFLNALVGIALAAVVAIATLGQRRRWLGVTLAATVLICALIGRFIPIPGEAGTQTADEVLLGNADLVWISEEGTQLARNTVPPDAILIADDWMAYPAVFATDNPILSPGDFDAAQVAKRLAKANGPGPLELNPLRASRYFPLVQGKSQPELDELLRQEIRGKLAQGKTVALLTTDMSLKGVVDRQRDWANRLGAEFELKQLGVSGNAAWRTYQISRRDSQG